MTMRGAITLITSAMLVLAACSPAKEEPAATAVVDSASGTASPESSVHNFIPTQAQRDRFLAEGPDPTLRKIAVADYWLHYQLMRSTGIEQELGGEENALKALAAIGEEYERRIRGIQADIPRLRPATFTGEGMSAGFYGMGIGSFLGMVTGGMISGAVSNMSDKELAEYAKAGPIKDSSEHGGFEMKLGEDGSLSQAIEMNVTKDGLQGKVSVKTTMDACPDVNGRVTVTINTDSQMSVVGKPGTGGHVLSHFEYERYLDDDAHLSDAADGSASKLRVNMGGTENSERQSVDIVTGWSRGGQTIFENRAERGYSRSRMEEVERTQELLHATQLLQTMMAEMLLRGMGSKNGSPWESGRCINLKVSSTPAKRKGLKPGTSFELKAEPRVKSDSTPAGGTVTAMLHGGSQLEPASGKVRADAKYQYVAPQDKDKSADVAFESRSKRGVGKATLEFDTKAAKWYGVDGGADEFHGMGVACDLAAPFTVRGSGVTVNFTPSSAQGGQYSYTGMMSGFVVWGQGTYTVNYQDDVAVSLSATGPGSVKTPKGTYTRTGSETYTLTPREGDCRG
jgi:hypothetical protein